MDRFRLKNVIILILLLLNVFLAGSLTLQSSAELSARQTSAEELSALFAADGITLAPSLAMAQPLSSGWNLTRDNALEQAAAETLLGGSVSRSIQGGGVYRYTGPAGAAVFRSDGSFEAAGSLSTDPQQFCADFCKTFDFDAPSYVLDENGSGSAGATGLLEGVRIANGGVTFTLEEGAVTAVSGVLVSVPASSSALTETPISALAALTAFQQERRSSGAVVSRITDTLFCYLLQSAGADALRAVPAWQIVTETSSYLVNALTGAVTAE